MKKFLSIFFWIVLILLPSCTGNNAARVWVASPWERVMRETPPKTSDSANLKAAANEYEPFRVIIHNAGEIRLENLNVTVSDLKNGEAVISAENLKLYRMHYLNVDTPSYRTKNPVGGYPDAMIPFMDMSNADTSKVRYIAAPFSVDTAQNADIWCDLFVPAGTKTGIYQGTVTVMSGNKKLAKIPVKLTVWGFEIPSTIALKSHFGGLNWESNRIQTRSIELMGIQPDSPEFYEMEKKYNKALLENRAVPSSPSNVWPEWNEKDGIIDRGEAERLKDLVENQHFNAINFPFRNEPKENMKHMAALAGWLEKMGYLDMSYVYLEDEPNTKEEYDIVRKQAKLLKSAHPGMKRFCTEQTVTTNKEWGDLYSSVDIWCPIWGHWHDSTAQERIAAGEELWSYTALCQGPEGTPWWQIDMEPVHFRGPIWVNWHYNITGFLYWASVSWRNAKIPADVWENPYFRKQKFWGEGCLLYPGQPAGIDGLVTSMRLRLYREAAEDYEYLTLAKNAGKEAEVDKIVDQLATSFQDWSHDPAAYEQARDRLAELIMAR